MDQAMTDKLPGEGLLGWLGRQVGHVKKAIRADPGTKIVYRKNEVEEAPHPNDPKIKLRRTTIDEVIVEKKED